MSAKLIGTLIHACQALCLLNNFRIALGSNVDVKCPSCIDCPTCPAGIPTLPDGGVIRMEREKDLKLVIDARKFAALQVKWGVESAVTVMGKKINEEIKERWKSRVKVSLGSKEQGKVTSLTFEVKKLSLTDNEDMKSVQVSLMTLTGAKMTNYPLRVEGKLLVIF